MQKEGVGRVQLAYYLLDGSKNNLIFNWKRLPSLSIKKEMLHSRQQSDYFFWEFQQIFDLQLKEVIIIDEKVKG